MELLKTPKEPLAIQELMALKGGGTTYDEAFRENLEYFIPHFQKPEHHTVETIDPAQGYRNEGDFYALLQEIHGVTEDLFWFTMRINNYICPTQYTQDRLEILIPNTESFRRIERQFFANRTKNKD